MAQIPKIVDLTKSFIVVDPNAFPQNLGYTEGQDTPEKSLPILGFEGYNFLPTAYGYRSYFGQNSTLDIAALASNCDEILLYQFATYENILVALCEDGIWVSRPNTSGNLWVHSITLALPAVGTVLDWTWAVIENKLYLYRQGGASYYRIDPTGIALDVVTVNTVTPNFLNMVGQMGIFRANGRLGFWDSANSVSWSSLFDHADFIPAAETLAGNSIFNGVSGRIVTIIPQGDGFVIYATKSIVGVRYSSQANILWEGNCITDLAGIVYPFQATRGLTELEHFVYTSSGIKKIGNYNALNRSHTLEDVIPDVYDLLKESRSPVKLQLINGRFLCICLIDNSYIDGKTIFTFNTIDVIYVPILVGGMIWDGITPITDYVDGISVSSHMASELAAGIYEGMYLRWTAQGEGMVPSRTTPMNPYTIDTVYAHIPNPPPDLTSKLSQAQANALVSSGSFTDETPEVAPFYPLGLGWTYPGSGNTGAAYKGLVDNYLTEIVNAQIVEWNDFINIQAATKATLDAAVPVTESPVLGTVPYFTNAEATAARNSLVASLGGSNNQVTTVTVVGNLLSGAGAVTPLTITGAGTNYPAGEMSKDMVGGWDIKRTILDSYYITRRDRPGFYIVKTANSGLITDPVDILYPWLARLPYEVNPPPIQYPTRCLVEGATRGLAREAWLNAALLYAPSTMSFTTSSGWRYEYSSPTVQMSFYTGGTTYSGIVYQTNSYHNDVFQNTYQQLVYKDVIGSITGTPIPSYYIDYTSTKSITTEANPTISHTSIFSATQKNLTWAYISGGSPPGDYASNYGAIAVTGSGLVSEVIPYEYGITYPGATHLLQDGQVAPIYPSYAGALVLDLALKKWGKIKATYKTLLDYSPVNALQDAISYTNFGMDVAMLNNVGAIILFDARPTDSWIRYGKFGYYRLGYTQVHEVKVQFRSPSIGEITLDSSFDGRSLETAVTHTEFFSNQGSHTMHAAQTGRWHTVKISGNYDLTGLEIRGTIASRR